jgi:tRNA C32,U32 (ribose-2'-O)-methylase TrmJ
MSVLQQVAIVLNKPQDPVNIAATVRVMKNFGFDDLRLVQPVA